MRWDDMRAPTSEGTGAQMAKCPLPLKVRAGRSGVRQVCQDAPGCGTPGAPALLSGVPGHSLLLADPLLTLPGWQSPCPPILPPTPSWREPSRTRGPFPGRVGTVAGVWAGDRPRWRKPLGFPADKREEVAGCLLFPQGRDRIWPGELLAWPGAEGLPAGSPVAALSSGPIPEGAQPCKAHSGGRPAPLPTTWPPTRPA